MFMGTALHNVDAKGRVFIPSKFRCEMGKTLIVCRSPDGCIRAYTPEAWQRVADAYAATSIKTLKLRRRLFASAESVDLDAQGRILLPEELRTEMGINDKTRIVGLDSWMEFWDPDKYDLMMSEDDEDEFALLLEEGLT